MKNMKNMKNLKNLKNLLMVGILISIIVIPANAWSTGGCSMGWTRHPHTYGMHDYIFESAVHMLPPYMQNSIDISLGLYGSEFPDCVNDTYAGRVYGIGDMPNHHVSYYKNGSLQIDSSGIRAQQTYDNITQYIKNGDGVNTSLYIGTLTHYIADPGSYAHTMGNETDWGNPTNHQNYEFYVASNWMRFGNAAFDGVYEPITAYDAALKMGKETTFDQGGIYTNVWMDNHYAKNWSDSELILRTIQLVIYAVNYNADVIHKLLYDNYLTFIDLNGIKYYVNDSFATSVTVSFINPHNVTGTNFRINNGAWSHYSSPFVISNDGITAIDYYSVNGNIKEPIRTKQIGIYKASDLTTVKIISSSPTSPVNSLAPANVTFNIAADRLADVIWIEDGKPVQWDYSVMNSNYTNVTYADKHSIVANVNNAFGMVSNQWVWNGTGVFTLIVDIPAIPLTPPTAVTFTAIRACGIEIGDNCTNLTTGFNMLTLPVDGATISLGNTTYTGNNTTDINGQSILSINPSNIGIINVTATKYLYLSASTNITAGTTATLNLSLAADITNIKVGEPTNVTLATTRDCGTVIGDNCSTSNAMPVLGAKITLNGSNGTYAGNQITDINGQTTFLLNATHNGPIRFSVTKYRYNSTYTEIWAGPIPPPTPNITVDIPSSPGNGGGGGSSGGGGGGGGTDEPYDNILKYESQEHDVYTTPVSFKYTIPELGIYNVWVTSNQNSIAALRIEVLKDTSKLVGSPAPGLVYKNINAWMDYKRMKNATMQFKVENSWIDNNGLSGDKVKLSKWDNASRKWIELSTTMTSKDDVYTYFDSQTTTFSSFAINGIKDVQTVYNDPDIPSGTAAAPKSATGNTPEVAPTKITGRQITQFEGGFAIAAILVLLTFYLFWQKRK